MKLLTAIPTDLAKVAELVERNVSADIEVLQQATFPLLDLPAAYRFNLASGATVRASDSSNFYLEGQVINAAALQQTFCILSRGVWDVVIQVSYSSTYRTFTTEGLVLDIFDPDRVVDDVMLTILAMNTPVVLTV